MPRRKRSETVSREQYEVLHGLYTDLLAKYHALKVAGASVSVPPVPLGEQAPDPALAAAYAKAGGNQRLMAHYVGFIAGERARGVNPVDIAAAIEVGMQDDLGSIGVGD